MAPRDIERLTSFRACEMLRMFKGCYDEETEEFDGAKLAGFRTKIELQALDALRQWDLDSIPPIHRPTGKGITVVDLKRIMGSRGLGIGTSEDSCAVARKPLWNKRPRSRFEEKKASICAQPNHHFVELQFARGRTTRQSIFESQTTILRSIRFCVTEP